MAHAEQTQDAVRRVYPDMDVQVLPVGTDTATLSGHLAKLKEDQGPFVVGISLGLPREHAAWFTALAEGHVTARVVQVEPCPYASTAGPLLTDLEGAILPGPKASSPRMIREPAAGYFVETPDASPENVNLERALRRLRVHGEHPAFRQALETAAAVAGHNVPVLIEGETGTGKTVLARLLHELSDRATEPFVVVNCGALPEKLVESILFGHRKGAFTGATDDQPGKFELADGGTLLLDEIGELPLELQPKLLTVLEGGTVEPLGASTPRAVNVRVIAATNRDLGAAVAERAFREDLYYRLSFSLIHLPPLRERRSDIASIALQILDRLNESLKEPKRLTPEALQRLERHEWQGNVRDLENVIGRSVLLTSDTLLDADDLVINEASPRRDPLSALPTPYEGFCLEDFLCSCRHHLVLKALDLADGNQSAAARLLGMSPQAVSKFLKGRDA
jgi:transcriptional regulator with GAF, ATPase, and Fis domain